MATVPLVGKRLASLVLASLLFSIVSFSCGDGGGGAGKPDGGGDGPDGSVTCDGGPCSTDTCGDSLRQTAEACDDGNKTDGDGCSADCKTVESGWSCEVVGRPCVKLEGCGNGRKEADEECDDRNVTSGDGCSATCKVEPGWNCPSSGGRCHAAQCNDGIKVGEEECEDGNVTNGDGCSSTCRLEEGWKCPTVGAACTKTTCGDKIVEGTEECDDGNKDMGDGCSPFCKREPQCTNGTCTATCGDGVMLPGSTAEECDDGNVRSNDGCSSTCKLEEGFVCKLIESEPPARVVIPAVFRDFIGFPWTGGHADFQNKNGQSERGIVKADLTKTIKGKTYPGGKPDYAKDGTDLSLSTTNGRTLFEQWYTDDPTVNRTVVGTLDLVRQSNGSYVFDDQDFFPLDTLQGTWVTEGKEQKRNDNNGTARNFHFTSEARYWFEYKGTEVLSFRGDDDVWVFINGKLAVDLGGVHGAESASLTLSTKAADLGLQVGRIYEVVVFQAERHTTQSSYRLTLNNFITRRTECRATCGNNVIDEGEECDDGVNAGGYGQCSRGCVWGPRCGDGKVQSDAPANEECDDGNTANNDGCNSQCRIEIN
ncbi:DUF4215 domain-containing protein [Myxococcus stipitatus]|uniref:DUF4215 domain-containing protein n=1 Tax=Myxococcus stipitatus TaxID=83455 RepID=UPI0030CEEBAF